MLRCFIVFLMLVVPLQLAWGAVAAYCEHEGEAVSDHFGHHAHEHEHDSSAKTIEPSDDTNTSNFDLDTGVGHVADSIALCSGMADLNFDGSNFVLSPAASFHLTFFSAKPERPKWSGLA